MTRRLVVDTSVMQAAGETQHPVSSACRVCLEEIRRICHRVAVTPAIQGEWKSHMSRFSRKWYASMTARRKLSVVPNPPHVHLDVSGLSNSEKRAVEKDRFLLEAALSADCLIVTRDTAFRAAIAKTPEGRSLNRRITWIDPLVDGVQELKRP